MSQRLARRTRDHVDALCAMAPDRSPGSPGNRAAAGYVADTLRGFGLEVEVLAFETIGWRTTGARLSVGGRGVRTHAGPYSPSLDTDAPLVAVSTAEGLTTASAEGAILLVHGPLAAEQLTPRHYPWYDSPEHVRILDDIERLGPVAVVAATGRCAMAGGLAPFPLVEDADFLLPSAYVSEAAGAGLLRQLGATASLTIRSQRFAAGGEQPVARLPGSGPGRVLVTGHLDAKPGTPGALDNAAGTAVVLAVAELLAGDRPRPTIEFVAFNGEDHYASPGEVAYLQAHPEVSDITLVVNIDAAGSRGGPSAVSAYGLPPAVADTVARIVSAHRAVAPGAQWWASDHAIFAMRGVPALAITSPDFEHLSREITHTPGDSPDLVDEVVLADTALFIADVVRAVARPPT